MTPNRSLALTVALQNIIRTDLLQLITEDFPFDIIESYKSKAGQLKRDRVYNEENTLLTMLVSAVHQDKSLEQSVMIFRKVFENRSNEITKWEAGRLAQVREQEAGNDKKRGRPRLYQSKLPKSKTGAVSANTAAYSKARLRLDYELIKEVFNYSKNFTGLKQPLWYGMQAYNTDGTYIQMQDSKELASKYYVKQNDDGYPQALLQVIVRQGSGQIMCFNVGSRHQSELELVTSLINQLHPTDLLLADDLYNSYAIFAVMQQKGCHIIVPGKRKRNYEVIQQLAEGDQIVEVSRTQTPSWWSEKWELPEKVTLRRICYLSAVDASQQVLYTTLADKNIPAADIIVKYIGRWDIEITIREIKTLMDVNIVRSKTESMVLKELTIALTAYNMIRKLIAKSVEQTEFSPQKDIVQEFFALHKELLVDKKGRVYNRWSTGRYGQTVTADQ